MAASEKMLKALEELLKLKDSEEKDTVRGQITMSFDTLRKEYQKLSAGDRERINEGMNEYQGFFAALAETEKPDHDPLSLFDNIDERLVEKLKDTLRSANKSNTAAIMQGVGRDDAAGGGEPAEGKEVDGDLEAEDISAMMERMNELEKKTTAARAMKETPEEKEARRAQDRLASEAYKKADIDRNDPEYLDREGGATDKLDTFVEVLVRLDRFSLGNTPVTEDSFNGKVISGMADALSKEYASFDAQTKDDFNNSIAGLEAEPVLKAILNGGSNQLQNALSLKEKIDVKLMRAVSGVYGRQLQRQHESEEVKSETENLSNDADLQQEMIEALTVIKSLGEHARQGEKPYKDHKEKLSRAANPRENKMTFGQKAKLLFWKMVDGRSNKGHAYTRNISGKKKGRLKIEGDMLSSVKVFIKAYQSLSDSGKEAFIYKIANHPAADLFAKLLNDKNKRHLLGNTKKLSAGIDDDLLDSLKEEKNIPRMP